MRNREFGKQNVETGNTNIKCIHELIINLIELSNITTKNQLNSKITYVMLKFEVLTFWKSNIIRN